MCVLPFNKKKVECKKGAGNKVRNKKKKVDLWLNALLESKLLHPRKTMNYLQPSLITSLRKVLLIQFVCL